MTQKTTHSEATSSDIILKDNEVLSPDVSLSIILGETPLPKKDLDPIIQGLKFLKMYFVHYPFNIDDESHNNSLNFILQFIQNLVTEQNTNLELFKLAFSTLSSMIRKIVDPERVNILATFFTTYLTSCQDPTLLFALNAFGKWLSSKTITHMIVDNNLLTFFIQLLVKRDEELEKCVLKCIASIARTKLCFDDKSFSFIKAFIHFTSLRFNERTNNIIPYLEVLYFLTLVDHPLIKIVCDIIYQEEIFVDLNNFMEIEYDENTKPIIIFSLKIWCSLIQKIPISISKVNFPHLFNLMRLDDNDISNNAIVTISTMICSNKETIPALLALGLLDAIKNLLETAGFKSHGTIIHLIYILVNCKLPEVSNALLQMEIIHQLINLMENENVVPHLKMGLDIIEELLNQESELNVNVHDYVLESGGENVLGELAENEDERVSTKANFILDTYFPE